MNKTSPTKIKINSQETKLVNTKNANGKTNSSPDKTSPTKNEFNLSDKIEEDIYSYVLNVEDVKEFIRLLKEKVFQYRGSLKRQSFNLIIDTLAGEDLK